MTAWIWIPTNTTAFHFPGLVPMKWILPGCFDADGFPCRVMIDGIFCPTPAHTGQQALHITGACSPFHPITIQSSPVFLLELKSPAQLPKPTRAGSPTPTRKLRLSTLNPRRSW